MTKGEYVRMGRTVNNWISCQCYAAVLEMKTLSSTKINM